MIVRKHDVEPAEAIATEARRGYDLLVVGVEEVIAKGGGFHDRLSALVSKFEGSIAIIEARGAHEKDAAAAIEKVFVPVTGNENARRGAEVAITLAKAVGANTSTLSIIGQCREKPPAIAARDASRHRRNQEDRELCRDENRHDGPYRRRCGRCDPESDRERQVRSGGDRCQPQAGRSAVVRRRCGHTPQEREVFAGVRCAAGARDCEVVHQGTREGGGE